MTRRRARRARVTKRNPHKLARWGETLRRVLKCSSYERASNAHLQAWANALKFISQGRFFGLSADVKMTRIRQKTFFAFAKNNCASSEEII